MRLKVEAFSLVEDHQMFHFQTAANRDAEINGGSWFVAGQLLAIEPWVLDFVLGMDLV